MDEKDRFDRFAKLAEFRLRRWETRRSLEWKISLSFWGLLVASIHYAPPKLDMWFVSILLVCAFVGYVWLWSIPALLRNDEDMATAFHYMSSAEKELDDSVDVRAKPERLTLWNYIDERKQDRWGGKWSPFFQIAATAIFSFVAWWFIALKS